MLYVWIHKDLSKDNYYHTKDCQIVKSARSTNPTIYKSTSRETARESEHEPCPKCRPDDFEEERKITEDISKRK